jgi:hypothetical protein
MPLISKWALFSLGFGAELLSNVRAKAKIYIAPINVCSSIRISFRNGCRSFRSIRPIFDGIKLKHKFVLRFLLCEKIY